MSCEYREIFLEKYFEEGIEKGMSEEEAAAYALKAKGAVPSSSSHAACQVSRLSSTHSVDNGSFVAQRKCSIGMDEIECFKLILQFAKEYPYQLLWLAGNHDRPIESNNNEQGWTLRLINLRRKILS